MTRSLTLKTLHKIYKQTKSYKEARKINYTSILLCFWAPSLSSVGDIIGNNTKQREATQTLPINLHIFF